MHQLIIPESTERLQVLLLMKIRKTLRRDYLIICISLVAFLLLADDQLPKDISFQLLVTDFLVKNETDKRLINGLQDIVYSNSDQLIVTVPDTSRMVVFTPYSNEKASQVFQAASSQILHPDTYIVDRFDGARSISIYGNEIAVSAEISEAITFFQFSETWQMSDSVQPQELDSDENIMNRPNALDFGNSGNLLFVLSSFEYELYVLKKESGLWAYKTKINYAAHYSNKELYPPNELGPGRDGFIVASDYSTEFHLTDYINNALISGSYSEQTNTLEIHAIINQRSDGWSDFKRPSKFTISDDETQLFIPAQFNGFIYIVELNRENGLTYRISQIISEFQEGLLADNSGIHQIVTGPTLINGNQILYATDLNSNAVNVFIKVSIMSMWKHDQHLSFPDLSENDQPLRGFVSMAIHPAKSNQIAIAASLSNQIITFINSATPIFFTDVYEFSIESEPGYVIQNDTFIGHLHALDLNDNNGTNIEIQDTVPFYLVDDELYLENGQYNSSTNQWNFTVSIVNSFNQSDVSDVMASLIRTSDIRESVLPLWVKIVISGGAFILSSAAVITIACVIRSVLDKKKEKSCSPEAPEIRDTPSRQNPNSLASNAGTDILTFIIRTNTDDTAYSVSASASASAPVTDSVRTKPLSDNNLYKTSEAPDLPDLYGAAHSVGTLTRGFQGYIDHAEEEGHNTVLMPIPPPLKKE